MSQINGKKPGETIEDKLRQDGVIRDDDFEEEIKKDVVEDSAKLVMRIDKIEGKLEIEQENRNITSERISRISEDIGDLRRMILDREGAYTKFEANFEKIQNAVEEIEPKKIAMQFEKFNEKIDREKAETDKVEIISKDINKRLKMIEEKFSKIKSVENLVDTIKKIDEKIKYIDETKHYTDRIGGKIESIFSDITDKLTQLRKERETILTLDDVTKDLMKDIDRLKFRFDEEAVNKKELEEIKKAIEKEVVKINPEKFRELEKKVESFDLQAKSTDELEGEKEKIEKLLKRAESDYKAGGLSNETYEELKKANEERLKRTNAVLVFLSKKMLYNKIKDQDKRINEVELNISGLPKGEEIKEFFKKINTLRGGQSEIEELKRKLEDLIIVSDRIDYIESNIGKLRKDLAETSQVSGIVEELKMKREEFKEQLNMQTERIRTSEKSVKQIKSRLNELFEHIINMEEELEKLNKKERASIDAVKLKNGLTELKELVELTGREKVDKKELEAFESKMEGYIARYAQIIKKISNK